MRGEAGEYNATDCPVKIENKCNAIRPASNGNI